MNLLYECRNFYLCAVKLSQKVMEPSVPQVMTQVCGMFFGFGATHIHKHPVQSPTADYTAVWHDPHSRPDNKKLMKIKSIINIHKNTYELIL